MAIKTPYEKSGAQAVLVAAADTPSDLKGRADFIGTGDSTNGGDELTIADALSASNTVILMPGTFWVTHVSEQTYSILLASGKTLMGSGVSSVIKIRNSENATLFVLQNSDIAAGNNRIAILNLKIDGNRANQASGGNYGIQMTKVGVDSTELGAQIEGCWIENLRTYGIGLTSSYNSIIRGNFVRYCSRGIMLSASHNSIVANNHSSTNTNDGIHLEGAATRNVVIGNYCHTNTTYGVYVVGSFNIIEGNYCYKNLQSGIYLDTSNSNLIKGNFCTENSQEANNTYYGIGLLTSDYNSIQGNTCRQGALANKPSYGIAIQTTGCDYNMIHGNDLYDSGTTGDLLDNGNGTLKRDNRALTGSSWLADV